MWIDRLRPLMIAADAGRALALASIPVGFWMGRLSLGPSSAPQPPPSPPARRSPASSWVRGAAVAVLADSASFALSAIFVIAIRGRERRRRPRRPESETTSSDA